LIENITTYLEDVLKRMLTYLEVDRKDMIRTYLEDVLQGMLSYLEVVREVNNVVESSY